MALLQKAQKNCPASANPTTLPDYCPYIDNGTNSQPIKLAAGVQTDATQDEIATIATQTWSQVLKLNVSVNQLKDLNDLVGLLFGSATNPAQMWQIGWLADYPDPQDWLSLQFNSASGNNIEYVNSPSYDNLMNEADANQNQQQRMSQYHQIEQYMVDQCAWIPFAQEKSSWRLRPWVQGFGLNEVLLMEDVDWPNVYILAH